MTTDGQAVSAEFEALLDEVLEPAYRTAFHLTRSREDAEELVQEAALLAHRGFGKFQVGTNFRAWFLTILRNRFVSDYRKQKRQVETVDLVDAPDLYLYRKTRDAGLADRLEDPARFLIEGLDANRIMDALAELPDEFRDAATLYFTQDLSYGEIAGVLGVPVGTVRSRLHRGRKLLQKQLATLAEDFGILPPSTSPGGPVG